MYRISGRIMAELVAKYFEEKFRVNPEEKKNTEKIWVIIYLKRLQKYSEDN